MGAARSRNRSFGIAQKADSRACLVRYPCPLEHRWRAIIPNETKTTRRIDKGSCFFWYPGAKVAHFIRQGVDRHPSGGSSGWPRLKSAGPEAQGLGRDNITLVHTSAKSLSCCHKRHHCSSITPPCTPRWLDPQTRRTDRWGDNPPL